jgi:hypothetical protein
MYVMAADNAGILMNMIHRVSYTGGVEGSFMLGTFLQFCFVLA